jgi:hypothetical protein
MTSPADVSTDAAPAAPKRHPHFQKRVEADVAPDTRISVEYQTVTFGAEAADALRVGQTWHLASTHFETTTDLEVGGVALPAGRYALKTRKEKDGQWSLVIDEAAPFRSRLSDAARFPKTEFTDGLEVCEHLHVDVHPAGDKENVAVFLEVRFDTMRARCRIDLPQQDADSERPEHGGGR